MQTWIDPKCDRSRWPPGDWDGEPDKAQWTDEATGLTCLAKRHSRSGHWCGYVGVTEGHPWFGRRYDDLPDYGPTAHGGLTYAAPCQHRDDFPMESMVCHVPNAGEPDSVWWFGFDCAHCGDRSPRDEAYARDLGYPFTSFAGETYKTLEYVKKICTELAAEIKAVA